MARYPIYVISKGRADRCLTAKFLIKDQVPFKLVVEPQEADAYRAIGAEQLEVLPFSNLGLGSIPARNWVWEHAKAQGHDRHWILDDNIHMVKRRYQGKRIPCNSDLAFSAIEDFTDRYSNIGISGMNYEMFLPNGEEFKPFVVNCHCYSCLLIRNDLPYRWRGRYNEDTDLCLQVLSGGLCTIQVNCFLIFKVQSMRMKGGNTDQLYQGDGRLHMARALERMWPGVVTVVHRYGRPQHRVKKNWRCFTTPLQLKDNPAPAARYPMALTQRAPIEADSLRQWYESVRERVNT